MATMKQKLCYLFALHMLLLAELVSAEVLIKGLFNNMVVLEVDGQQRTLRVGQQSPEGIELLRADTKSATLRIDGEEKTLGMSRRIGGVSYREPEKDSVRISRGQGGHYFTPGRINKRPVNFLVDTGATAVVMNSGIAKMLGLNYLAGTPIRVNTASGTEKGYRIMLNSVSVGTLQVNHVVAVVTEGEYPLDILLGNSYLERVDFEVNRGVLVLQARF